MRNENSLLEFNVMRKMSDEIDHVMDQLLYSEDALWESGADELKDMIDTKVVEIDMLLSRIKFAAKVNAGIIVETDEEINKVTKDIKDKIDSIEEEDTVVI